MQACGDGGVEARQCICTATKDSASLAALYPTHPRSVQVRASHSQASASSQLASGTGGCGTGAPRGVGPSAMDGSGPLPRPCSAATCRLWQRSAGDTSAGKTRGGRRRGGVGERQSTETAALGVTSSAGARQRQQHAVQAAGCGNMLGRSPAPSAQPTAAALETAPAERQPPTWRLAGRGEAQGQAGLHTPQHRPQARSGASRARGTGAVLSWAALQAAAHAAVPRDGQPAARRRRQAGKLAGGSGG